MKTLLMMILLALPIQDEKSKAKAEPNDAEKLFNKMSEKITKAKTFQATFTAKLEVEDDEDESGEMKGTIWLKGEKKLRVEIEMDMGGKDKGAVIICDGEKMQTIEKGREQSRTEDALEGMAQLFRGSMARAGFFATMFISMRGRDEENADAAKMFPVSEFKMGKKEKVGDREAQIIEYKLKIKDEEDPGFVKVWIDTETHLPLKRILRVDNTRRNRKVTVTETYKDVKTGVEIDDKKFEIKDEK